jgi:opacity protein-like surface antigen
MNSPRLPRSSILTLGLFVAATVSASAQLPNYFAPGGGHRAGAWDGYVVLGGAAPDTIRYDNVAGSGSGAEVDIDTHVQGGVGVGYNLNQFWNVNFELMAAAPDFTATSPAFSGTIRDSVYQGSGKLNLDFHLLPGRITPLVSAGIGFVTLTVNDPDSGVVCYPDYWWGYVCYESSQTEAAFTWNVGAGLRADLGSNFFVKAVAGVEWWLLGDADNVPYSIFGNLSVGMTFR